MNLGTLFLQCYILKLGWQNITFELTFRLNHNKMSFSQNYCYTLNITITIKNTLTQCMIIEALSIIAILVKNFGVIIHRFFPCNRKFA